MSMMVSFVLSFFPRDVLDEILNLIESVSEDFPSYSDQGKHYLLSYISMQKSIKGKTFTITRNRANTVCFQEFLSPNTIKVKIFIRNP